MRDWLVEIRRQLVGLREHQATPLTQIVRWTGLPPTDPLFETLLMYEHRELRAALADAVPGWDGRDVAVHRHPGPAVTVCVFGEPSPGCCSTTTGAGSPTRRPTGCSTTSPPAWAASPPGSTGRSPRCPCSTPTSSGGSPGSGRATSRRTRRTPPSTNSSPPRYDALPTPSPSPARTAPSATRSWTAGPTGSPGCCSPGASPRTPRWRSRCRAPPAGRRPAGGAQGRCRLPSAGPRRSAGADPRAAGRRRSPPVLTSGDAVALPGVPARGSTRTPTSTGCPTTAPPPPAPTRRASPTSSTPPARPAARRGRGRRTAARLRLVHRPRLPAARAGRAVLHLAPLAFDAATLELLGPLLLGGAGRGGRPGRPLGPADLAGSCDASGSPCCG